MTRNRLLQLVSDLNPDDAVGQQVLLMDRVARSLGAQSSLLTCRTHFPGRGTPEQSEVLARVARINPEQVPAVDGETLCVLHHSIGSPAAEVFLRCQAGARVMVYHNVTPPALLGSMPGVAALTHWGLRQLPELVRAADGVVGCSQFNLLEVEKLGPGRSDVVWLAPPPDRMTWLRQVAEARRVEARGPDPRRPRVLAVGRLVPSKNLGAAVDAMAALRVLLPGSEPVLRVAGPIADPEEPVRLRQRVREQGLPPESLEILGPLSMEQLCEEWKSADVLVQPSLHEGFGMPPVEAMVAGVPVVGSDSGALPEITGRVCPLIEGADPQGLARAIASLITDGEYRQGIVMAQNARASEYFAPEVQIGNLKELLGRYGLGTRG